MCSHYWQHAGSLSKAQCRVCGLAVERAGPDTEGRWHDSMPVALRRAQRAVKYPSNTQAAPHLA